MKTSHVILCRKKAKPSRPGKASSGGTLDANRTRDLPFRKGSLYPTELRGPLSQPSSKATKSVLDYREEGGGFQFFLALEE